MKTLPGAVLLVAALALKAADEHPLTLSRVVQLPGVKGRFDHFSVDAKGQRLFVAALGNNTVEVIDLVAGTRLHTITGLHKPTGVVYLDGANQIGIANGDDGTFRIYDGEGYRPVATIESLDDADNVRFDAKGNRIYVGYGAGALAIIDAKDWKLVGTIKLAGHPESFQLEPDGPRIWANVPDARQIAVIDREKQTVTATWPMGQFRANFPMALDAPNHRLFIGCREPARLVIINSDSGKVVSDLPISRDTDDLFYDAKERRIYISCGEGFVDVVNQQSADAYERRGRTPTRAGARTSFFFTEQRQFSVAVPQRGSEPAEIRVFHLTR